MRKFLLLTLLAPVATLGACELQPGPRPTAQSAQSAQSAQPPPSPPPSPPPTPDASPTPPATPPTDAASAPPKVEITPPCLEVAMHVAAVIIASAEPAQRSIFETERDRIVRSTGEVCTAQRWSDPAIRCYKAASTQIALKECEVKFPTQPVQRPQPKASDAKPGADGRRPEPGAGSAARLGSGSGAR